MNYDTELARLMATLPSPIEPCWRDASAASDELPDGARSPVRQEAGE